MLALAIMVLLPALYRMAKPFLTAAVLAAILAVALDPLRRRVGRLIPRSSLAALITTLVAVAPVAAAILFACGAMNQQIKSGTLKEILSTGERLTASASLDRHHVIQEAAAELNRVAAGLFTGSMAVLFLYVLLLHGQRWVVQLTAILPLDEAVTTRILATTRDSILANVDGILAVSAAQAVLFGLVFWAAGIRSPVMWGAIAGLASMVPVVGGMVVWLPIAVISAIHGSWVKALIVGAGCLVGQVAVSELLRPKVVGSRIQQPPLLIALSVLGGTDAFGPLGILLGPVILSVLAALVREFRMQVRPNTD